MRTACVWLLLLALLHTKDVKSNKQFSGGTKLELQCVHSDLKLNDISLEENYVPLTVN